MDKISNLAFVAFVIIWQIAVVFGDHEVIMAAVIFRHGDRTPVDPYPTDPYRNQSYWPVKFGELTNIGKMQHYKLGLWLRSRYKDFLSTSFDPEEIIIRSTDVDRSLMSAQANLAGMYPPISKDIWDPELHWQPIPVHTMPLKMDNVLAMAKPCPVYEIQMEKVKNSEPYRKMLIKYAELFKYLSNHTGADVYDFDEVEYIYNTLYIEELYNLTLPEWTKLVYPKKLLAPSQISFITPTYTPLMSRLKAGPLIKEITAEMDKKCKEESSTKVLIYSGHDTTIANILNALDLYDGEIPNYTATILIELLQANNTNMVRVLYRNEINDYVPVVLNIPSCGQLCPMDQFKIIYKHLITVEWEKECQNLFHNPYLAFFLIFVLSSLCTYSFMKIPFNKMCGNKQDEVEKGYKHYSLLISADGSDIKLKPK